MDVTTTDSPPEFLRRKIAAPSYTPVRHSYMQDKSFVKKVNPSESYSLTAYEKETRDVTY